jgi:hypothetical protein
MTQQLANEFRTVVQRKFAQLREDSSRKIRDYEVGTTLGAHEIEYLDIFGYDYIQNQIAPLSSLIDLGAFDNDTTFVKNLRFYVVILQLPTPIYCFRWYTPKKRLSREDSGQSFGALWHQDRYEIVEEDLLLFDEEIDCFTQSDHLFVLNKDKFQRIFQFFQLVQQLADTALKVIKTNIPIKGFDRFSEDCRKHTTKLIKLGSIAKKPYIEQLSLADIKKVLNRYKEVPVVCDEVDGREMLICDPSNHWGILHVLDDDYLESIMTGLSYESSSKRAHES